MSPEGSSAKVTYCATFAGKWSANKEDGATCLLREACRKPRKTSQDCWISKSRMIKDMTRTRERIRAFFCWVALMKREQRPRVRCVRGRVVVPLKTLRSVIGKGGGWVWAVCWLNTLTHAPCRGCGHCRQCRIYRGSAVRRSDDVSVVTGRVASASGHCRLLQR